MTEEQKSTQVQQKVNHIKLEFPRLPELPQPMVFVRKVLRRGTIVQIAELTTNNRNIRIRNALKDGRVIRDAIENKGFLVVNEPIKMIFEHNINRGTKDVYIVSDDTGSTLSIATPAAAADDKQPETTVMLTAEDREFLGDAKLAGTTIRLKDSASVREVVTDAIQVSTVLDSRITTWAFQIKPESRMLFLMLGVGLFFGFGAGLICGMSLMGAS